MQEPPMWMSFVPLIFLGLLMVYPTARILRRAGFSRWLALFIFVPIAPLIGLWVFAFARWPSQDEKFRRTFE